MSFLAVLIGIVTRAIEIIVPIISNWFVSFVLAIFLVIYLVFIRGKGGSGGDGDGYGGGE